MRSKMMSTGGQVTTSIVQGQTQQPQVVTGGGYPPYGSQGQIQEQQQQQAQIAAEQYGQPTAGVGVMQGRYYGTPVKEAQQHPGIVHQQEGPSLSTVRQGELSNQTYQSQQPDQILEEASLPQGQSQLQASMAAPDAHVPAPASVLSQPELPTPITGSGIDARSSSVHPTITVGHKSVETAGAHGSAEGRVALINAALNCNLPQFLVEDVLENPALSSIRDPIRAKVHLVELLKLLAKESDSISVELERLPVWKKYKSQDHSLFIAGAAQKGDYFLTDGAETFKLLTQEESRDEEKSDLADENVVVDDEDETEGQRVVEGGTDTPAGATKNDVDREDDATTSSGMGQAKDDQKEAELEEEKRTETNPDENEGETNNATQLD